MAHGLHVVQINAKGLHGSQGLFQTLSFCAVTVFQLLWDKQGIAQSLGVLVVL